MIRFCLVSNKFTMYGNFLFSSRCSDKHRTVLLTMTTTKMASKFRVKLLDARDVKTGFHKTRWLEAEKYIPPAAFHRSKSLLHENVSTVLIEKSGTRRKYFSLLEFDALN